jgi:N-acetylmuramoyl-L-alanine amidase
MKLLGVIGAVCIAFMGGVASAECNEVEVLALNMYHEARGDGADAMQMVGEVTLNRVDHPAYPDNICDVVYQRRQFSWVHTRRDHTPYDEVLWEQSLYIAEGLINGEIDHFDNGATHFLNLDLVSRVPRWAREFTVVGRIGGHTFYARD